MSDTNFRLSFGLKVLAATTFAALLAALIHVFLSGDLVMFILAVWAAVVVAIMIWAKHEFSGDNNSQSEHSGRRQFDQDTVAGRLENAAAEYSDLWIN